MGLTAERLGVIARPEAWEPDDALGVINPGGPITYRGETYIFPRHVARGNVSRIGIGRVVRDRAGLPTRTLRCGYALEPDRPYDNKGCEDARVAPFWHGYAMTYTAYSRRGARIAVALGLDPFSWTKLGPVRWSEEDKRLWTCDNKDAIIVPCLVDGPDGVNCWDWGRYALIHRPMFKGQQPTEIWISYSDAVRGIGNCVWGQHHVLLRSEYWWESDRIGAGTILPLMYAKPNGLDNCRALLLLYHGVHRGMDGRRVYSVGAALLDKDDPRRILWRSREPLFSPRTIEERVGVVPQVVFPTAAEVVGESLVVYYGAADYTTCAIKIDMGMLGGCC